MTALAGTLALLRLAFRRSRLMVAAWVIVLGLLPPLVAAGFAGLYPTEASRGIFVGALAGNPAMAALIGPLFAPTSIGGLVAWRVGATVAVLMAIVSIFLVTRHTRGDEEAGRLELIGSTPVGRHAPLAAALLLAGIAAFAVGALVAIGMLPQGSAAGAIALGLSIAMTGLVFAALAAVAAQLAGTGRGANGLALSAVGVAYLVRAAGDAVAGTGPAVVSWLSPIGWAQQMRPYAGERWWVAVMAAAAAALLAAVAFFLAARRDHGGGWLQPRAGPAAAGASLSSAAALAWRLQRGLLAGWLAAFAIAGGVVGGLGVEVGALVADNPQLASIIRMVGGEQAVIGAFFAAVFSIFAFVASAYAVQALSAMRTEETAGRAELVLSTATRRASLAASHLVFAAIGPLLLLAIVGAVAAVLFRLRGGEGVAGIALAGIAHAPAAWVLGGVAMAVIGFAPRLAAASWAILAACLLAGQFGQILSLPRWAIDLSPFSHTPRLPGGSVDLLPLAALTLVAVLAGGIGIAAFARRDIG